MINVVYNYPVPDLASFSLTSSAGATVINGSDVAITCTVEFGPAVVESELSLLMVDAQLFKLRNGSTRNLTLTNQVMSSTAFTYTTMVNSFSSSDSGNYSCVVTIRPSSIYLYGTVELSHDIQVTTGTIIT